MKRRYFFLLALFCPLFIIGQSISQKEINRKMQTWVSLNTLTKFNEHWGMVADFHERWNDFFGSNNFYFVRGGISYTPNSKISVVGGYAHMWNAPSNPDWTTYADENRIYEQVQFVSKSGKVSIVQRIRNEQRWQEKIVNDQVAEDIRFTNRIRYLASFTIPFFRKNTMPSLVIADELLIHFGSEVVYNTFDQNRLFIGIKQAINPKLSFDFGYMNVYQQKYSGYQYDMNHTLRLFFYLNTSLKTDKPILNNDSGDE